MGLPTEQWKFSDTKLIFMKYCLTTDTKKYTVSVTLSCQKVYHEVNSDLHQQFTTLHQGSLDIPMMILIFDTTRICAQANQAFSF